MKVRLFRKNLLRLVLFYLESLLFDPSFSKQLVLPSLNGPESLTFFDFESLLFYPRLENFVFRLEESFA